VVRSADQTLVLVSSGPDISDEAMLIQTRHAMQAGAAGIVFDRALAEREHRAWKPLLRELKHSLGIYCS
jgi:DhnA family fructose-bisphosphate aldolase class Ia